MTLWLRCLFLSCFYQPVIIYDIWGLVSISTINVHNQSLFHELFVTPEKWSKHIRFTNVLHDDLLLVTRNWFSQKSTLEMDMSESLLAEFYSCCEDFLILSTLAWKCTIKMIYSRWPDVSAHAQDESPPRLSHWEPSVRADWYYLCSTSQLTPTESKSLCCIQLCSEFHPWGRIYCAPWWILCCCLEKYLCNK